MLCLAPADLWLQENIAIKIQLILVRVLEKSTLLTLYPGGIGNPLSALHKELKRRLFNSEHVGSV